MNERRGTAQRHRPLQLDVGGLEVIRSLALLKCALSYLLLPSCHSPSLLPQHIIIIIITATHTAYSQV